MPADDPKRGETWCWKGRGKISNPYIKVAELRQFYKDGEFVGWEVVTSYTRWWLDDFVRFYEYDSGP